MKKLKLFFAALALLLGWSNASAQSWTSGAEVAAGEFYLYNIGADRYLNNGSSWSTHSIVDGQGFVITLEESEGKYKLKSGVSGGAGPYVWGDWTNNDNGTNVWYFAPVECAGYTNAYTLQQTNSSGTYLYWSGGGSGAWGNEVYGTGSTANGKNSYWLLIPKTTRQTLDGVTSENPLDVTYLINDPDFEKRVSNDGNSTPAAGSGQTSAFWTCGGFWRQYSEQSFANGIFFEKYAGGGLTTADKIYQSPTLKPGKYVLSATAYATCTKAYLYAGSASKQISAAGEYKVIFNVASESAVELGVKIEADGTGNWVAFDNVRLYYLGGGATSSITNPNFDTNADGWTGAGSWGNSEVEFYNATDGFDMYQDISDLDAGIYAVELQGFYRNGAGIDEKRAKAQESLLASIYAKGEDNVERSTSLLSIYEEAGKVTAYGSLFGDIPNWMNQAQDFISAGYYKDNKVIVEVGAGGTLRIGAKKTGGISNDWTILDNFTLTKLNYATLADAYAAEWTARKTSAQALLNSSDYSNIVSGSTQRTALSSAVSATPSDLAGYISALAALRTAVNNFKAAKYAYDLYATNAAAATEAYNAEGTTYVNVTGDEKTTFNTAYATNVSGFSPATNNAENYYNAAVAIGNATETFTDETIKNNYNEYAAEAATATLLGTDVSGVDTPTTSSAALTAAHSINVLNYNKVVAEEYEDVSATTLGAWTDNNVVERSGQHWDGTNESKYFEMNEGWGNTSWNMSRTQNVSLAAGKYILKVAARVSTYANATLSVTVGGNTISTISGHQGDTGKGITTSGVASYDAGTFANENNGRGFEWKYIPFELDETGSVTLSFSAEGHALHQYVSFTSLALLTDPKVAARTSLLNKINEATSARKTANEGTGVFQIPAAAGSTFATAISTAQGVYDDEDADLSDITTATSTLNTAIGTYEATELNAPDAEKRYVLTLDGKGALTFKTASTEGGYGMPFMTANVNLAQAFMFEAVSGNTYKLYFYDLDGNKRYLCTRADYGEGGTGTYGIRTATDKSLEILMQATATEGVFNMLNTQCDNKKLGSNGGDFYTDDAYTNWTIAEASQAEVAINIASDVKYATRIFPFDAVIPEGIKVYSCEAAVGNELTLVEQDAIEANKPYILEAESGYSGDALTGWGIASATSYTEGWLTGVYVATDAPNESYVLQNNDKVAFYKVDTSVATPSVGANRCYLSVPVVEGARAAYFFRGSITGVDNVEATATVKKNGAYLENGKIAIYKNGMKFSATGAKLK